MLTNNFGVIHERLLWLRARYLQQVSGLNYLTSTNIFSINIENEESIRISAEIWVYGGENCTVWYQNWMNS